MARGDFTFTLDNVDYQRLQRALGSLSQIEQDAVVKRGLQEGGNIIRKEGKKNLNATLKTDSWNRHMAEYMRKKRGNGGLEKSFSTKIRKREGKIYVGFTVAGHHAHLVDSGTKYRKTSTGAPRGRVIGSKFWRTAFETKKIEAGKTLMESIEISISKIIARNSR